MLYNEMRRTQFKVVFFLLFFITVTNNTRTDPGELYDLRKNGIHMLFYFLFIHSGKYTYFASEITVIIKLAAFQIKRNFFLPHFRNISKNQ